MTNDRVAAARAALAAAQERSKEVRANTGFTESERRREVVNACAVVDLANDAVLATEGALVYFQTFRNYKRSMAHHRHKLCDQVDAALEPLESVAPESDFWRCVAPIRNALEKVISAKEKLNNMDSEDSRRLSALRGVSAALNSVLRESKMATAAARMIGSAEKRVIVQVSVYKQATASIKKELAIWKTTAETYGDTITDLTENLKRAREETEEARAALAKAPRIVLLD